MTNAAKTPPDTEYAPEHSDAYRRRYVAVVITLSACALAVSKLWLFPALQQFMSTAHERCVMGIEGTRVLADGVMVGLPVFVSVILALTLGRHGVRILLAGQVPLPGEKVFKKTPVRRGAVARWIGACHVLVCALPMAIAAWGTLHADELNAALQHKPQGTPLKWMEPSGCGR